MNTRLAILFPDTVPSERMLIPLVQVFGELVYFQVVENDAIPAGLQSELCEEMVRESLCRIEVPAPLGEDRERFLRLLSDLQNRRDDYAARLGHVALAGISSTGRRAGESRTSILSRLLSSGGGMVTDDVDQSVLLLWQARLVLKLGEMYDAEQEQLNAELRRIRDKEEHLLNGLRHEVEAPFVLTGKLSSVSPGREELPQLRCRSWARMFALGRAGSEAGRIFLSGDSDAVDSLLEHYEKGTGRQPAGLMSCLLPAGYPHRAGLFQQIQRFRSESAALLENLEALMDDLPAAGRPGSDAWTEEKEDAWETLLAQLYPPETSGRVRLSLYACPGISPRRLFIDAFAGDRDEALMPSFPAEGAGLVLGVLRQV